MKDNYTITHGDCLSVLRTMSDASVDAVVTDPPAGISFMHRAWDGDKGGRQAWVAWLTKVMAECHRVLKPGGHALIWAIPRTAHWTTLAIEEAGFEIRDVVAHLHGQGFPKSLDISKAIDKAAGAKREVIGTKAVTRVLNQKDLATYNYAVGLKAKSGVIEITAPKTDGAKQWQGWGTALKPAREDWILARKPVERNNASNVLEYGTGALNIDACRIPGEDNQARYPANLVLSHNDECTDTDCESGCAVLALDQQNEGRSRFFYIAKTSAAERQQGCSDLYWTSDNKPITKSDWGKLAETERRQGNIHPTVKSVALMRWLTKLVTPPGGLVLDPFCGSGTTGVACALEGFKFAGIEMDDAYIRIVQARLTKAYSQSSKDWPPMAPLFGARKGKAVS